MAVTTEIGDNVLLAQKITQNRKCSSLQSGQIQN